jgi:hypothetical protein
VGEEKAGNGDVVVSVVRILLILTYLLQGPDYLDTSCSRLVNISTLSYGSKQTFELKFPAVNSAVAKKECVIREEF